MEEKKKENGGEKQKERDLKRKMVEFQEWERQHEYKVNKADKKHIHELALARRRPINLLLNESRDHYSKLIMPNGKDSIVFLHRFEEIGRFAWTAF